MKRKLLSLPLVISGACLLLSCSNQGTVKGLLYAPSPIEASARISENSRNIYKSFVDLVAPNFFKEFGGGGDSLCLSLPDLFLCYNMMALLSESSLQEAYLEELGASSINELATASKELIPFFCYVSEKEGQDCGAFNLNGMFYDPSLKLLDNADECFKMIADSFNGYVFSALPTTEIVDEWIREADKEGYLSSVPTPKIEDDTILCTVSSYALVDAFQNDERDRRKENYNTGKNRFEYTLSDGSEKLVDYLAFTSFDEVVETGDNYIATSGTINTCSIKAYYPDEGVGLSSLADSIFSDSRKVSELYDRVYLNIPMFDVSSSLRGHPSSLVPSFFEGVGTGFFEKNPAMAYDSYFGQNNKLTLDYNGFKGSSITVIADTATSVPPEEIKILELNIDRPFIFEISRGGLPLYYGQIDDPNYPLA